MELNRCLLFRPSKYCYEVDPHDSLLATVESVDSGSVVLDCLLNLGLQDTGRYVGAGGLGCTARRACLYK